MDNVVLVQRKSGILRSLMIYAALVGASGIGGAAVSSFSLTSPAALQIGATGCCIDFTNMNTECQGVYSVTATGKTFPGTERVFIPGTNGAIRDLTADVQIAASTPAGISTNRDSFKTAVDTALQTAAGNGSFNR